MEDALCTTNHNATVCLIRQPIPPQKMTLNHNAKKAILCGDWVVHVRRYGGHTLCSKCVMVTLFLQPPSLDQPLDRTFQGRSPGGASERDAVLSLLFGGNSQNVS